MQNRLSRALTEPVESLLESGGRDTWPSIRKLLKHETEVTVSEFSALVSGFELDKAKMAATVQNLRDYARNVVVKKAREEAGKVLIRMKDRLETMDILSYVLRL